ncbi:MAG: hypothetical protein HRU09_11715 [Oligoflexales bacterium]|nr:hypothetical protein [Oligoflexales bacterium]
MKYYLSLLVLMFWSTSCSPKRFKSDNKNEPVSPPVVQEEEPGDTEEAIPDPTPEPEVAVTEPTPPAVVETPPKVTPPPEPKEKKGKEEAAEPKSTDFSVGERFHAFQYHHEGSNRVRIADIEQHYCPLTGMTFEGMDVGDKSAACTVDHDENYWNVNAVLAGGNTSRLWCSSKCISWQHGDYYQRVSREVAKAGYKGEATKSLNRSSTSFCSLNSVKFHGVIDSTETAACVIEEKKDYWVLISRYLNQTEGFQSVSTDGGSKCKADCISWYDETHDVSSTFFTRAFHTGSKDQLMLAPKDYNFCALTGIEVKGLDLESESAHCEVYLDQNRWYLKAELSESTGATVECQARCIRWGELK